jgi:hypothetical protein
LTCASGWGVEKVSEHLRRQSKTDGSDGEAPRIDAVAGCRAFRRNARRLEELAPAVTILIPNGSNTAGPEAYTYDPVGEDYTDPLTRATRWRLATRTSTRARLVVGRENAYGSSRTDGCGATDRFPLELRNNLN